MSKMQVAFLKNDRFDPNFLLEKYTKGTDCVPVTIISSKLYNNTLMMPVGALNSCFLQSDVDLFL